MSAYDNIQINDKKYHLADMGCGCCSDSVTLNLDGTLETYCTGHEKYIDKDLEDFRLHLLQQVALVGELQIKRKMLKAQT